jgi:GT2 family glycosyltransferase/glycosyltransferase involved in cell wall biosynthesis
MGDSLPAASVVIPNYDGIDHLEACLESLRALDYPGPRPEVILVDNASSDGSVPLVRGRFPEVRVAQMSTNVGFAAACNRGAREASGSLVAFLNNDMRVEPSWLRELAAPLAQPSDIAATGSRILSWDGKAIDFIGGAVNFYGHGFQPSRGHPIAESDSLMPAAVLFACGGSMAVRRDLFLSCGAFDEDYFAFFEDIDLGWRLWVLGHRVLFVPSAVAYHKGHATGRKIPGHQLRVLYERNALATIIKNYDDANLARVLPAALLLAGVRALVYGEIRDQPYRPWGGDAADMEQVKRVGVAHLVALRDLAENCDRLWARRAAVQSARRRSDGEILGLLRSPFETNCFEGEYMDIQRRVQQVFGVDRIFADARVGRRVLVISNDVVNARMAGPGIRAWEMAHVLARSHPVTLAVPNDDPPAVESFRIASYHSKKGTGLRELAREHDVLIVQGFVLHLFPYLAEMGKLLVVDLYDPFTLENLHTFSQDPIEERTAVHRAHLDVLNAQICAGDFFLCASERQRDYWLGMLAANNRVNPHQYDADPTLRCLIDVVPFGVPADPPQATNRALKGVHPGIGTEDRVILWGGGIWEWFDPLTAIRAVERIRQSRPDVKLVFMGVKHPNPLVPDMAMTGRAMDLAAELELDGSGVFFNEWVPYAERQNYLLEADVGISLHSDHLETRFSFRTRVLDYIWAGLPIVCTRGDAVGEMVERLDLGHAVHSGDVDGVVGAILALLDSPGGKGAYAQRLHAAAAELTWDRSLAALVRFCAEGQPAADRAGPLVDSRVPGRLPSDEPRRSLLPALRRPATPVWALPFRAWMYLRLGGPRRLWQEVRSYVRWLRLRGQ